MLRDVDLELDDLDLEDLELDDLELELAGPHREASASCPQPTREVLMGFRRYAYAPDDLPPSQRSKLDSVAQRIVRSFSPGCQPLSKITLIGHADRDVQRGAAFERKIGQDRARAVRNALTSRLYGFGSGLLRLPSAPSVASIQWIEQSAGATRLLVPNPMTEGQRATNRRVEIWLQPGGKPIEPDSPPYIRWVQGCLNTVMGLRLALNGIMSRETRSAIGGFQRRGGLAVNGLIDPPTVAALIRSCGFPLIVPVGPATRMRPIDQCGNPSATARWVGNGGDNIREDVRNTMDRLHRLWSLSNADYNAEYPAVSALPQGSVVPDSMIQLTIAAISRNFDPVLQPQVALYFLNLSLSGTVGRNQTNNVNDILALQFPLRALGFLGNAEFATESAAVKGLTTATAPDAVIPKTIDAIRELKDAIAGGRVGWAPIRADESDAGGDRFGARTFTFSISSLSKQPGRNPAIEQFDVSIFVPRGAASNVNKVHVFFSPGFATGNSGLNATLMHGLRFASEASDWILISVPGIPHGWRTIDRANISACLTWLGRPAGIDALRLSGHSRGGSGLRESIERGFLAGAIDRVFILDASDAFRGISLPGALRKGHASAGALIQYAVNLADLPGATNIRLDKFCVRAIGYTRLIQDAMTTRPDVAASLPAAIRTQLLTLPARGNFTTNPGSAPGQPNIRADCNPSGGRTCFCRSQQTNVDKIIKQQNDPTIGLRSFIESNNLTRFCSSFIPEIYSHHMFVAEIAHELVA